MGEEILAIAFVRPEEGQDEATIDVLRDLYDIMTSKNYSRNILYRDAKDSHTLVNLRYWSSEEARHKAHEDPDVHRCWARLGQIAKVELVVERLDEIALGSNAGA